jgi:hypothetical protein
MNLPRGLSPVPALLAALTGCAAVSGEESAGDGSPVEEPPLAPGAVEPWRSGLDWVAEERRAMGEDLEAARAGLERLLEERGEAELAARLAPPAPAERPTGWGLLPELLPSDPPRRVALRKKTYSLEWLSTGFVADARDAFLLRREVEAGAGDGSELLEEFERLRGRHWNLGAHLDYHRYWQGAVLEYPDFFEVRNGLAREAAELQALGADDPERRAALRAGIAAGIAPFEPTAGLAITSEDGERLLRVPVLTDIDDDVFLARLSGAVAASWTDAPAARDAGLRVELAFERVPLERLYPVAPPARGAAIDEENHLARFGEGRLVLTTGAKSTHAFVGRAIVLGTEPTTEREWAHEVGHLLGFTDGYLRSWEEASAPRWGRLIIEWVGVRDDLMGSSRTGLVDEAMVAQLLDAYSGETAP